MVNGQSDLLESGVPHESMKSDWYKDDKFGRGPSVFLVEFPVSFQGILLNIIVQQRITLASLHQGCITPSNGIQHMPRTHHKYRS